MNNSTMPLISVILPVYNAEKTITAAVKSIIHQSYQNFELIIIDDGSVDNTQLELKKFSSDERIHIYATENKGIVAALNYALDLSRGEFIARMDADDISLPQRFEVQLDFFKKNPQTEVLSSSYKVFEERNEEIYIIKQVIHPSIPSVVHWMLRFYCVIAHPAVMFRRSVIDAGLRYPMSVAEDLNFWRSISNGKNITNLPEVHLLYRRSSDSLSRVNSALITAATQSFLFKPSKPTLSDLFRDLMRIRGINKIGIIIRWLND